MVTSIGGRCGGTRTWWLVVAISPKTTLTPALILCHGEESYRRATTAARAPIPTPGGTKDRRTIGEHRTTRGGSGGGVVGRIVGGNGVAEEIVSPRGCSSVVHGGLFG